jgi:hypothetical protein
LIKEYCLAISKGTISTAHFQPVADILLPQSASQSCLGYQAYFPRPSHLGKPFDEFDCDVYEPHMATLQAANNKGKIAELKFSRNMVAYLLEACFHSFR